MRVQEDRTQQAAPSTAPLGDRPELDGAYLGRPDGDLTVPDGEEFVVETDDGAHLSGTLIRPQDDAGGPAAGTRLPVVMPHCWTGDRRVWTPVARRLVAAGHAVVVYDQRGHGASSPGSATITVERLGRDLAAVLDAVDAVDLSEVVIAGHSMGGMTTMAFACGHPDVVRRRVRGLVLVATGAHGLGGRVNKRFWRIVLWRSWIDVLMRRPRLGRLGVRGTFGADPRPEHVEATRRMFVDTRSDVRRACAEAMADMDLREGLRAVDAPAVVLLGRRDTLIPNKLTRAIVDHVAGAQLVELGGAGHMLPFERPDEVAAQIVRMALPSTSEGSTD